MLSDPGGSGDGITTYRTEKEYEGQDLAVIATRPILGKV
jgi:hypothetical protein